MAREENTFVKTILFKPSIVRRMAATTGRVENVTLEGRADRTQPESVAENFLNTGSFRFDPPGFPLKSTQQLNIDWRKWEQHTFFNSAESKVNVSFDNIINRYPFDGSKKEHIDFFNQLTGYEKYVYDKFPKNVGYLNFSGSSREALSQGTHIEVRDVQGLLYPTLTRNRKESGVLNPRGKSFSVEMF